MSKDRTLCVHCVCRCACVCMQWCQGEKTSALTSNRKNSPPSHIQCICDVTGCLWSVPSRRKRKYIQCVRKIKACCGLFAGGRHCSFLWGVNVELFGKLSGASEVRAVELQEVTKICVTRVGCEKMFRSVKCQKTTENYVGVPFCTGPQQVSLYFLCYLTFLSYKYLISTTQIFIIIRAILLFVESLEYNIRAN